MGGRDGPLRPGSALPAFAFPEPAAGVLGRHLYGAWLADEVAATVPDVGDIDRGAAHAPIAAAVERGDDHLDVDAVVAVLRAYGVARRHPLWPGRGGRRPRRRGRVPGGGEGRAPSPRAFGPPGVALDLAHEADVTEAVDVMREALGDDAANVLRPADGGAGAGPADPQQVDEKARSTRRDRARRLDGRPRERRGVAAGAAVVGSAAALLAGSRAGPALAQAGLAAGPVVETLMPSPS